MSCNDRLTNTQFGPYIVLAPFAVTAGADKASSPIGAVEIAKGCAQITIATASAATAASTLKLQASLDGLAWWDTSTNHAVAVSSNAWNAIGTNSASFGFSFSDVYAPQLRLFLDAGADSIGTVSMQIVGRSE
jgi:hypothetical protein